MNSYQQYADHHLIPRREPLAIDLCDSLRIPKDVCGCPDCCMMRAFNEAMEKVIGSGDE